MGFKSNSVYFMQYLIFFLIEIIFLYFLSKNFSHRLIQSLYYLTKNKQKAIYLYSLIFLPGIFIHEMAHLLMALILLVPVGGINFLSDIKKGGGNLGSVEVGKTDFIRSFFIAVAPLIFGFGIIFVAVSFVTKISFLNNWLVSVLVVYIIFEVANNMFISRKDVKAALGLIIFFLVISIVFLIFGSKLFLSYEFVLSKELVLIFKQASLYLLVPLFIDSVLVFLFKILGF